MFVTNYGFWKEGRLPLSNKHYPHIHEILQDQAQNEARDSDPDPHLIRFQRVSGSGTTSSSGMRIQS